jgi:hypothetical protein
MKYGLKEKNKKKKIKRKNYEKKSTNSWFNFNVFNFIYWAREIRRKV